MYWKSTTTYWRLTWLHTGDQRLHTWDWLHTADWLHTGDQLISLLSKDPLSRMVNAFHISMTNLPLSFCQNCSRSCLTMITQILRYSYLEEDYGKCLNIYTAKFSKRKIPIFLCKICYFPLLQWWGEKINSGCSFFFWNFRTFTDTAVAHYFSPFIFVSSILIVVILDSVFQSF